MSFLAPFALFLVGAAAVPLALHLLRRKLGEKVDFPAMRYLLRAEREHSRQLRMKNLLLMLLRVLAVLALALAAARPVGRLAAGGHAPTAFAIVLDNSLSTSVMVNGSPVLARLKDAARAAIDRAGTSDKLWLVTADDRIVGGSASAVRAALDRVEPLAGAGDLGGAVARATQLTKSAGIPARQVAIITDGQATAWQSSVALDGVPATVFAPSLTIPRNRAVVRAVADPPHWTPRGSVRATTSAADSVTFRVLLGTRVATRGTAAPGTELVARLEPPERGWFAGSVELEPDELRGDDVRWFAVHVGPAPAVTADGSVGAFAKTALDALAQDGRIARGSGVTIAEAEDARTPAVLFAPSSAVQIGAANRALERAGIPWTYGAPRTGPAAVRGTGLAGVTATRWYALQPTKSANDAADTLASVGGDPWVVAGPGYVLVASPLSSDATDLPLRANWVPWLGAMIAGQLAGDAGAVTDAVPGALVARPVWAHELEGPGGERIPVRDARIAAPTRPGVYFWMRNAARAGALVVNPEVEESDLRRLSIADLKSRFIGADVQSSDDAGKWLATAYNVSGQRALEAILLVGALLLLGTEGYVTRASADEGTQRKD